MSRNEYLTVIRQISDLISTVEENLTNLSLIPEITDANNKREIIENLEKYQVDDQFLAELAQLYNIQKLSESLYS